MYEAWFVIGLLLKLGRGCSFHRKVCRGVCTSVCYVYANILLYILICMVVEKRGSFEPCCYLRSGYEYRSLMCSLRKKCTFTIFCHPLLRLQRAAGSCWCMVLHPAFYTWPLHEFPAAASDRCRGRAVVVRCCWFRRGFPPYFHEFLSVKNEQIYFLCLTGLVW